MKFHNEEAEATLVCQMILKPEHIPNIYDFIKPITFTSNLYKTMYEIVLKMQEENTFIDQGTFSLECKDAGIDINLAMKVCDKTFSATNWKWYAEKIKQCYVSNSISERIREVNEALRDDNGGELSTKLIQELTNVSADVSSCEVHDMQELCTDFIQHLDQIVQHKALFTGLPTGLGNLDEVISGLQNEYIVIGARPSMGKTALGEQIALHIAGCTGQSEGLKVGFIELEMSPSQLVERAIANMCNLPMSKLRTGFLSQAQLGAVAMKTNTLFEKNTFIPVSCQSRNIEDIIGTMRRLVRNEGVKVIFVDHIGLIKSAERYSSKWELMGEISHTFQQIQRELNIPVVVLSQVGRQAEGAKSSLADLRGSGAIEEDADTVMFIERNRSEDRNDEYIPTKIKVMKNRNGACGTANVIFCPKEVVFIDDDGRFGSGKDNKGSPNMDKAESLYRSKYVVKKQMSPKEDFETNGFGYGEDELMPEMMF